MIVILITFVGCQNEAEQNQDAIDEVTKTQEDLREALEDAKVAEQNLLVSEEWILFKQTKAIGRNLKLNLKTICLTWVKPSIISQLIMLNKCQKLKEKKSKRVKY